MRQRPAIRKPGHGDSVRFCVAERHRRLSPVHADVGLICFNGVKASELFRRLVLPELKPAASAIRRVTLPSTSPAHAAMPFKKKLEAWRKALAEHEA
jgi:G:T/U-mismatch repair DNA glycosylase